ncbi:MAG: SRPBCC domain-containing protein [Polyangiaceae bacterium]|nr:SRPBCC domain-containing protein [Polyangiaceae bacterium]
MSTKEQSAFRLQYSVNVTIAAPRSVVWAKLTNAKQFSTWNSTVTQIEGDIALGNKLAITVPIAPGRVFKPKVVEFTPEEKMVWQDGFFPMFQGTRTFTLTSEGSTTRFEMVETFRGMMLPMIKGSLPDFGPVFDTYAADLKKACESG